MNKTREELIAECQHDIQRYEQCGKVLYGYSWSRIANLQMSIDEITLHYSEFFSNLYLIFLSHRFSLWRTPSLWRGGFLL